MHITVSIKDILYLKYGLDGGYQVFVRLNTVNKNLLRIRYVKIRNTGKLWGLLLIFYFIFYERNIQIKISEILFLINFQCFVMKIEIFFVSF